MEVVMLKMTILGEKIQKSIKGGDVCCWGGPEDSCDCTHSNGEDFDTHSKVWLDNMANTSAIVPIY